MRIEVQLFAAAREAAGAETVLVEVPQDATAADVIDAVGNQLPMLTGLLPSCRLAVDNRYVDARAGVSADCEVALILPVSGG